MLVRLRQLCPVLFSTLAFPFFVLAILQADIPCMGVDQTGGLIRRGGRRRRGGKRCMCLFTLRGRTFLLFSSSYFAPSPLPFLCYITGRG